MTSTPDRMPNTIHHAHEQYPGRSDEIPVFPPPARAPGIPEWLRQARPDWYRSDAGPVLRLAGPHPMEVRSEPRGWIVDFDGSRTRADTFEALLAALEEAAATVVPALAGLGDGVEVQTSVEPGFAADLLWWLPEDVVPTINGIEFDTWYDAPAPDRWSDEDVWELVDELYWELESGYSMAGSYGTISVWRIGARFVGDDDGDCTIGSYTGPEVAIGYFQSRTSPELWEAYGLLDPATEEPGTGTDPLEGPHP